MIKNSDYQFWQRIFYFFGIILIASIWVAVYTGNVLVSMIPAAILFIYL
jgi:uncharacterized membrane protein